MSSNIGLYQAYAAILLSALLPIIAGSHASLLMPSAKRRLRAEAVDSTDDEEDDEAIDRLTASDAYLFPIIGSVVLFSLFLAFKYLGKDLINRILAVYFALVGAGGVARMASVGVKAVLSPARWKSVDKWQFGLRKNGAEYSALSFTSVDAAALLAAVALSGVHHFSPFWLVSNFIALSLSFNAISLLRLDSFWTGSALLSGLFLYDIWWVFGTDVMESVARNFDGPIKIVWPKELGTNAGFTLLGLGDIVLPGVFIALCLRFDYSNALRSSPPPLPSEPFKRPYFFSCFVAYIAGLATTIVVMHTFHAAQPALLYLSPACILSVIICAWVRGETTLLWGYDDGENEEKAAEDKKKEVDVGDPEIDAAGVSSAVEGQAVLEKRANT